MISSIMLLIDLIKKADTFKAFIEAIKDPENKSVYKAFILLLITIILLIVLIYYIAAFQSLDTSGIRRTMKESPETIIGNWWCQDMPFIWWTRSGTSIVIKNIDPKSFENPAYNHWLVIEDVDGLQYKMNYQSSLKVEFDDDGTLTLTTTKDEQKAHYRFAHILSYLILYHIETDDRIYCKSEPGHLPESIRDAL